MSEEYPAEEKLITPVKLAGLLWHQIKDYIHLCQMDMFMALVLLVEHSLEGIEWLPLGYSVMRKEIGQHFGEIQLSQWKEVWRNTTNTNSVFVLQNKVNLPGKHVQQTQIQFFDSKGKSIYQELGVCHILFMIMPEKNVILG